MPQPDLLDESGELTRALDLVVKQVFWRFDADGDGALSVDELQAFARVCNDGDELCTEEVEEVQQYFDCDSAGGLTALGFSQMWHMQAEARPEDTWADLYALSYTDSLALLPGVMPARPQLLPAAPEPEAAAPEPEVAAPEKGQSAEQRARQKRKKRRQREKAKAAAAAAKVAAAEGGGAQGQDAEEAAEEEEEEGEDEYPTPRLEEPEGQEGAKATPEPSLAVLAATPCAEVESVVPSQQRICGGDKGGMVLGYWNTRVLAHDLRMMLAVGGVQYEDRRYEVGPAPGYDKSQWLSQKERTGGRCQYAGRSSLLPMHNMCTFM